MDQLQTVVAQTESVLNPHPLSPLSDAPDDCTALTPGHFLVGERLVALSEPDLTTSNRSKLSHWQEMKRAVQDLWRCWQLDYVSQLPATDEVEAIPTRRLYWPAGNKAANNTATSMAYGTD